MKRSGSKRWWIIGAAIIAVTTGYVVFWDQDSSSTSDVPTFVVQRGNLQINVLQGGEIRALKNYEVKSEIEYPTKILSLIPEGYLITEEDVKEGKVLVELDGSELKDKISTHEIEFQTTVATYIDVDENREIVRSENQSLVRDVKTAAMFALMDFEKYLGKGVAASILKSRALPENTDAFEKHCTALEADSKPPVGKVVVQTDAPEASAKAAPAAPVKKPSALPVRTDFVKFLDASSSTDGEAQQKLGQLKGELLLHQGELSLAKQTLESSSQLASKSFITKSALENDQVTFEKVQLSVKTAEVALDLFRKYEFSKQCEQYLSAYQESLDKLRRTIRANRSKMAQAESRFETAKRRYEMELAKREELERQLKACVIRAVQPGLVAYGPINGGIRYNEPIEEGAAVRLRQTILTIPDMEGMGVHVSVHESQVKKVKIGQRVRVRVDAEPGRELYGQVAELAVLPDSTSSRYTPNLKVYPCSVHIEGAHDWLKPGMNAKVEIIVSDLADVLYVPVQAIEVENDRHFCYVNGSGDLERREVATGSFNDDFIQVLKGLQPGENVALTIPKRSVLEESLDSAGAPKSAKPDKSDKKAKKAVAAAL